MVPKFWKRPRNAYESLRPLSVISSLSSASFNLSVNKDKEVRTSKIFFLTSTFHFLFYLLWFIQQYVVAIQKNASPRHLGGVVVMATIFGFGMFRRQKLVNIIQNSILVDNIFERLDRKMSYKSISLYSFLASIVLVILNLIYALINIKVFGDLGDFLIFFLPHINTYIMVLKFLCITKLVQHRFNLVNKTLQNMLDTQKERMNSRELSPMFSSTNLHYNNRQNPENTVQQVSQIHSLLCSICESIEDFFSYPLLITIALSSFFIVIDSYFLVKGIRDGTTWDAFLWHCTTQVSWAIGLIILVVEASRNIASQSSTSANLVYDIVNITDNVELRGRLSQLSLQLTNRKVSLSVAGLFDLDRSLILAIAGTATCYLIVLSDHAAAPKATNTTKLMNSTDSM